MTKRGHIPIRTCISCGSKRPKEELYRIVAEEGVAVWDAQMKRPGRGAYVCKLSDCLNILMKKKRDLSKRLKTEIKAIRGPMVSPDSIEKAFGGMDV